MFLAFWKAPRDEDVDEIEVQRAPSVGGVYATIATIDARDTYDNWITHFEDVGGSETDYYRAQFVKSGSPVGTSQPFGAVAPYEVTPQMVLDTIQGLPLNDVDAYMVQLRIKWSIEMVEQMVRQSLSVKQSVKEPYDRKIFNRIMGNSMGFKIQLRRFPVIPHEIAPMQVYYRVRLGGAPANDSELQGLDILVEGHNPTNGYNRGMVSIYPSDTSFAKLLVGQAGRVIEPFDVNVLITYSHGYTIWPAGVAKAVTQMAAADIMEIAGEAETAGLSSRSIDSYAESYTASATTTIFSARRIWYEDQFKKMLIPLTRKGLWG